MGEAETVPSDEKQAEICTPDESIVWSQEVEVCLFHAMLGHKPVGKMQWCEKQAFVVLLYWLHVRRNKTS